MHLTYSSVQSLIVMTQLVDVLDCTGAGDVDTSEVVHLDENGCIKGVNGKCMKVHPDWKNPSGASPASFQNQPIVD